MENHHRNAQGGVIMTLTSTPKVDCQHLAALAGQHGGGGNGEYLIMLRSP